MIGLVILAVLVLLVLAAAFLRLGAAAGYDETGGWVKLRLGPAWLTLYPISEEKEKRKKEKARQKAAKKAAKQKNKNATEKEKEKEKTSLREKVQKACTPGGAIDLAMDLLPKLKDLLGDLRHAIRVDTLSLHLVWGEPDPADAAMHYGQAWGVLEALLALLEANVTVKKRELSVELDYQLDQPRLTAEAAFSITVAQLLAILWPTLKEALQALWKWKKPGPSQKTMKRRAAAMVAQGKEETHGKEPSCE